MTGPLRVGKGGTLNFCIQLTMPACAGSSKRWVAREGTDYGAQKPRSPRKVFQMRQQLGPGTWRVSCNSDAAGCPIQPQTIRTIPDLRLSFG